jgi:hypothetical protein
VVVLGGCRPTWLVVAMSLFSIFGPSLPSRPYHRSKWSNYMHSLHKPDGVSTVPMKKSTSACSTVWGHEPDSLSCSTEQQRWPLPFLPPRAYLATLLFLTVPFLTTARFRHRRPLSPLCAFVRLVGIFNTFLNPHRLRRSWLFRFSLLLLRLHFSHELLPLRLIEGILLGAVQSIIKSLRHISQLVIFAPRSR